MTRKPSMLTPIAIILGFAILLGSLEAASLHVMAARVGRPMSWGRALLGTFPSWLLTIALAWPVRWLTQRARIDSRTWPIALPLHALGAAVFVCASLFGSAEIFVRLRLAAGPVSRLGMEFLLGSVADQVAIYCAIVAAFHALDFSRRSAEQERERAQLVSSLTEARLQALRSQLRPHFFFNTLNAISSLALERRPQQLVEMVGALGELVRSSLDGDLPHEVPLRRELELLELYLEIQRVRFADWLRIEKQIDPRAGDVLVPSLVLQPLVENAIEHGTQDPEGLSRVGIRCRRDGEDLILEVENRCARPEGDQPAAGRTGTGLQNTRSRLEYLYPGRFTLDSGQGPGPGFVVRIRIPARTAGDEASPTPESGARHTG